MEEGEGLMKMVEISLVRSSNPVCPFGDLLPNSVILVFHSRGSPVCFDHHARILSHTGRGQVWKRCFVDSWRLGFVVSGMIFCLITLHRHLRQHALSSFFLLFPMLNPDIATLYLISRRAKGMYGWWIQCMISASSRRFANLPRLSKASEIEPSWARVLGVSHSWAYIVSLQIGQRETRHLWRCV